MSDLVERLRDVGEIAVFDIALCNEAADRIEALEAKVKSLSEMDKTVYLGDFMLCDRIETLEDENRRLRERLGEIDDDRRSK